MSLHIKLYENIQYFNVKKVAHFGFNASFNGKVIYSFLTVKQKHLKLCFPGLEKFKEISQILKYLLNINCSSIFGSKTFSQEETTLWMHLLCYLKKKHTKSNLVMEKYYMSYPYGYNQVSPILYFIFFTSIKRASFWNASHYKSEMGCDAFHVDFKYLKCYCSLMNGFVIYLFFSRLYRALMLFFSCFGISGDFKNN